MVQIKNKNNIPKLRFAGFSSEWESTRLGDIVSFLSDYTANGSFGGLKENVKYYSKENYSALVRTTDLEKEHFKPERFTDEKGYKFLKKTSLVGGELIMSNVGYVGKVYKVPNFIIPMTLAPNTYVIKFDINTVQEFMYQLMSRLEFRNKVLSMVGGGFSAINKANFRSIDLSIPNKPEQQKIAEFLGSVDEWIENLKNQKQSLEAYKKGLMQKIFSQEIRFKDNGGKEFPRWQDKRLVDVANIIMGQSPDSVSYNIDGLGKYLIQGNADIIGRKTKPRNWTTQITKECQVGDIIMTVRAPVGYIAISSQDACIGRGVCAIRNMKTSDIDFLFQFLLGFEKKWIKFEQGTTFTAVNTQDVKNLKLFVPSLPEQQKIADFLGSVDDLIESKQRQITEAEQWKKGLMQGLFV